MLRIIFLLLFIISSQVSAITTSNTTTTITITTTTTIATTTTATTCATTITIPESAASTQSDPTPSSSTSGIWSPMWLDAATYTLIIYDALAMGLLCWLWLSGHLAWMKKERNEVLERDVDMEMVELERMGSARTMNGRDGRRAGSSTMIEGEMRRLGLF